MKTITHIIIAGAALLVVSAAGARAADWKNNLYFAFDTGGIFQQNADFSENGHATYSAAYDAGVRTDLAIGYRLNETLALEVEPGFAWNSLDTLNGANLGRFGETIDIYSVPILVNLVYTFQPHGNWTPYAGVGIGANIGIFDGSLPSGDYTATDVEFAFQAEAGVRYAVSDHASFGIAYKFLGTTTQNYSISGTVNNHVSTDNIQFDGIYIHGIFANFTWTF
jgi:opacity protein-like surface antigen